MRRLVTAVPTVVTAVAALLALSTGTALAHGSEGHSSRPAGHSHGGAHESATHHDGEGHGHRGGGHHGQKPLITLTGVVSDTPTAAIDPTSDTATSTITITVPGGERSLHSRTVVLTLTRSTVIRRGDRAATVADLRLGDHVSVRVRRLADGSLLALRLNVSGGREQDTD